MDPVAFELGPFTVRWYGLLMSTAIALGTYLAYRQAERDRVNPEHILNLVLVTVPFALIGARIYYVIFRWDFYRQQPEEIIAIWHGGLAIHGALIAGTIAAYLYIRKNRLNFWQMADIVAPSIVLGQAIGRWGNFFNQEAYGYPTNLPWAMYIAGEYRHPTFLYESLWDLAVFVFLLWLRKRQGVYKGDIFLSYLGLYSLGRFIIEGFRTDSLMLGPLRMAQVISVVFIFVSAVILYRRHLLPSDKRNK
ncbi:prolipoprotein diacylglyceryl transferase [Calderihabitans maritimus]|uniref:Phosphatidylglycerol--prolipoprotein diacylglyceryl transferase n=1 Tax=Calderihabitans maritimus TaxID=1246530 RepID=A0A1Z5HQQ6_9FIRM|nr:prolipoprotein diacylglyceryl transferase [Calderihabitans maritimus]GAW91645.1 prolipoprotein diacylglyceryl transferase [Calderihabitans maritimus]